MQGRRFGCTASGGQMCRGVDDPSSCPPLNTYEALGHRAPAPPGQRDRRGFELASTGKASPGPPEKMEPELPGVPETKDPTPGQQGLMGFLASKRQPPGLGWAESQAPPLLTLAGSTFSRRPLRFERTWNDTLDTLATLWTLWREAAFPAQLPSTPSPRFEGPAAEQASAHGGVEPAISA